MESKTLPGWLGFQRFTTDTSFARRLHKPGGWVAAGHFLRVERGYGVADAVPEEP